METGNKIVSFFGHREINLAQETRSKIAKFVEELIVKHRFGIFCFGGLGDFDQICWEIVTELKEKYPFVQRVFFVSDMRYLNERKRPAWLNSENYESIEYIDLDMDWWYTRIYYRNIEIIRRSDFVIFGVKETQNSGANKAMNFAKKIKKDYINIFEKDI